MHCAQPPHLKDMLSNGWFQRETASRIGIASLYYVHTAARYTLATGFMHRVNMV